MDVVKTNVEKIGGSLEIQSEAGRGTTLTIKIPLTLAIIPALIVSCDGDRYLISQINLVEVLHIDGSSGDTKIEMAGDAPVLRLRGKLLPVVHLRDVLELPGTADDDLDGVSIAVLHADGCQFGLVVDQINDTEEIVVKPLSPHVKGLGAFAGTTIMGDGAVSLILDATGVARLGGVLREQNHSSAIDGTSDRDERRGTTEMVLVCTVGSSRIGIPLALVSRLEELPTESIERASGHDVIQYRGRLLRLIYLDELLESGPARRGEGRDKLPVLVYETDNSIHGLVVDDIVDVFETDLSSGEPADRAGLRMSGIIGRRVTDLLDIEEIIARAAGRSLAGSGSRP
jgi:two-component system chemotaxis sensor kinase CheA